MKKSDIKINDQQTDAIEKGYFKDQYLIYNRKSTDDANNQKNSLKYQKSENIKYASLSNLNVADITVDGFCREGVISEKHSAFKSDELLGIDDDGTAKFKIERPKFHRLMQYLNRGLFKGVIFLCWDRASRNEGDETILKKLMRNGVDIKFALTNYDKSSSGDLHMDIDGMFAKHHSRVTKEKVSLTFKKKRAEGICVGKAPVGYLNTGNMEKKPLDPIRAPIIKKIFELAGSEENWSLADLAIYATEHGFTMNPSKRPRTKEELLMEEEDEITLNIEKIARPPRYTSIGKILRNFAYTGKIWNKDTNTWVDTISYEPLVTEELFFRVQKKLSGRRKSKRYNLPKNLPFRQFIYCENCNLVYTPYSQKDKVYFYCRCKKDCPNSSRNIGLDDVVNSLGTLIKSLSFTPDELKLIDKNIESSIDSVEEKRISEIGLKESKKRKLRESLKYLRANKMSLLQARVFTPEAMFEEEAKLEAEILELISDEHTSEVAMIETIKETVKLSELLKNVEKYWDFAEIEEKEEITKIILSELSISENTLYYKVNSGFKALEKRFISVSDLTHWMSGAFKYRFEIQKTIIKLENILNNNKFNKSNFLE